MNVMRSTIWLLEERSNFWSSDAPDAAPPPLPEQPPPFPPPPPPRPRPPLLPPRFLSAIFPLANQPAQGVPGHGNTGTLLIKSSAYFQFCCSMAPVRGCGEGFRGEAFPLGTPLIAVGKFLSFT
jgi:hypothetical protein